MRSVTRIDFALAWILWDSLGSSPSSAKILSGPELVRNRDKPIAVRIRHSQWTMKDYVS